MENKLQELTNKLYEEGLAKGRSDAEKMIAEAQARAAAIEKEAREQAAAIEEQARRQAEELRRNTLTEITLAGRQAVTELRERIAEMIVAKTVAPGVHAAAVDPAFIRQSGRLERRVLLPLPQPAPVPHVPAQVIVIVRDLHIRSYLVVEFCGTERQTVDIDCPG